MPIQMGQGVKDLVDSKKQINSISGLELSSVKSWELNFRTYFPIQQFLNKIFNRAVALTMVNIYNTEIWVHFPIMPNIQQKNEILGVLGYTQTFKFIT